MVRIDQKSGELTITRRQTVVATRDEVINELQQIALEDAVKIDANVEIGHVFTEALPLFDFGRVMSLTGKQVITQKVREAERAKQFEAVSYTHLDVYKRQFHRGAYLFMLFIRDFS